MELRTYRCTDAEEIVKWITDERAMRKWSAHWYTRFPVTADDMNRLYDRMTNESHPVILTAVDGNEIVGHLILRLVDKEKMNVRFGFVIVNNQKRGKGYGRQMLELAAQYSAEKLHARQLSLGVFENNLPAIKCYQAAGFHIVETDDPECFHAYDEEWRCLEMERKVPPE